MKKAYHIVLFPDKTGYSVHIPAFDGWTEGSSLVDALYMAQDYIGSIGMTLEDMGKPIPEDMPCKKDTEEMREAITSYIAVDFDEYRRKHDNRKIKKTLTIKSWLNAAAEKEHINFSRTLEEALLEKLHLKA